MNFLESYILDVVTGEKFQQQVEAKMIDLLITDGSKVKAVLEAAVAAEINKHVTFKDIVEAVKNAVPPTTVEPTAEDLEVLPHTDPAEQEDPA